MTIGVVLAGGASRRFGSDKSLYFDPSKNTYWVKAAYAKLSEVCQQVVVSANRRNHRQIQELLPEALVLIDAQPYEDFGPLGGLYQVTGYFTGTQEYLILAVDYPDIDTDTLRTLLQHQNCYAVDKNQRAHYTVAHLSFSQADVAHLFAEEQHRVQDLLAYLQAAPQPVNATLKNSNHKGDLPQ